MNLAKVSHLRKVFYGKLRVGRGRIGGSLVGKGTIGGIRLYVGFGSSVGFGGGSELGPGSVGGGTEVAGGCGGGFEVGGGAVVGTGVCTDSGGITGDVEFVIGIGVLTAIGEVKSGARTSGFAGVGVRNIGDEVTDGRGVRRLTVGNTG